MALPVHRAQEAGTNEPTNAEQTLTNTGSGGTFTIASAEDVTAALAWDAADGVIEAALEGLSDIGAGNVTYSGGTIEFVGDLAEQPVDLLVVDDDLLTGGAASIASSVTGSTGQTEVLAEAGSVLGWSFKATGATTVSLLDGAVTVATYSLANGETVTESLGTPLHLSTDLVVDVPSGEVAGSVWVAA